MFTVLLKLSSAQLTVKNRTKKPDAGLLVPGGDGSVDFNVFFFKTHASQASAGVPGHRAGWKSTSPFSVIEITIFS